jgi:hypothetical protein
MALHRIPPGEECQRPSPIGKLLIIAFDLRRHGKVAEGEKVVVEKQYVFRFEIVVGNVLRVDITKSLGDIEEAPRPSDYCRRMTGAYRSEPTAG